MELNKIKYRIKNTRTRTLDMYHRQVTTELVCSKPFRHLSKREYQRPFLGSANPTRASLPLGHPLDIDRGGPHQNDFVLGNLRVNQRNKRSFYVSVPSENKGSFLFFNLFF